MFEDLSAKDKALIAFIGFIILAGALENIGALFFLLLIGGFAYYDSDRRRRREREQQIRARQFEQQEIRRVAPAPPRREQRPANMDQVYPHALEAARAAGLNPDTVPVLPVDIGVLTYQGNNSPVIHRTVAVENDCDYIQPFIQLRVPRVAVGRVRFELLDNTGQLVFVHEADYQLQRGRNLIIPASRLPVHDEQESGGEWQMVVSGDNLLLAKYHFGWTDMDVAGAERFVGEDGEINSEMRAALADNRYQRLTLDELLSDQEEEEEQARPRRAAQ